MRKRRTYTFKFIFFLNYLHFLSLTCIFYNKNKKFLKEINKVENRKTISKIIIINPVDKPLANLIFFFQKEKSQIIETGNYKEA